MPLLTYSDASRVLCLTDAEQPAGFWMFSDFIFVIFFFFTERGAVQGTV